MYKVLLVDDSPLMRQFVARTLAMTGFEIEVHQADNGREAIRAAHKTTPDLIITDLNMPEFSGEELLSSLAADEKLSSLPVIVLTADVEKCRAGNSVPNPSVRAYLQKPVHPGDLRQQLDSLFAKQDGAIAFAAEETI